MYKIIQYEMNRTVILLSSLWVCLRLGIFVSTCIAGVGESRFAYFPTWVIVIVVTVSLSATFVITDFILKRIYK